MSPACQWGLPAADFELLLMMPLLFASFVSLKFNHVQYHVWCDVLVWPVCLGTYRSWLVVWNIFICPCIGNNHPNWLIFFRGVETTNQNHIQQRFHICFHDLTTTTACSAGLSARCRQHLEQAKRNLERWRDWSSPGHHRKNWVFSQNPKSMIWKMGGMFSWHSKKMRWGNLLCVL